MRYYALFEELATVHQRNGYYYLILRPHTKPYWECGADKMRRLRAMTIYSLALCDECAVTLADEAEAFVEERVDEFLPGEL